MSIPHWALLALFILWFITGCIATVWLYVGYGFVMNAQDAAIRGRSQPVVIKVDSTIAFCFILLDAYLNLCWLPVWCLDPRKKTTWNLVTGRLCIYNTEGYGSDAGILTLWWYSYHKWMADLFAAFLDGKDIHGGYDHIKGINRTFNWLGELKVAAIKAQRGAANAQD